MAESGKICAEVLLGLRVYLAAADRILWVLMAPLPVSGNSKAAQVEEYKK